MTNTNPDYAYAGQVKELILKTPKLFVSDDDKTAVWFEKEIAGNYSRSHTIADCLVFSEQQGVIGIEIKTARDSKARLRKQLADYAKVCDYVWVLIHDTMLPEVEPILEDYPFVGIICYSEVDDMLVPGVVKAPNPSPKFELDTMLDMLWSVELYELDKRGAKDKRKRVPPRYKLSSKKKKIDFIKSMGEQFTHDEFVKLIVSGYKHPDRTFSTYDFKR